MNRKVKKAVFPVAGFGTRFLPAQDGLLEAIHLKGKRFDCGSVDGFMTASAYEYAKRLEN